MKVFKPNGAAPSLRQVVALAQSNVNAYTKRNARAMDREVYAKEPRVRRAKRKSKYERINERYDNFYSN